MYRVVHGYNKHCMDLALSEQLVKTPSILPQDSKRKPWKWTKTKVKAAKMLVEGELKQKDIALELGVAQQTLSKWSYEPEFALYIKRMRNAYEATIMSQGIANRANRVKIIQGMQDRLQMIVDARAEANSYHVGGASGYIAVEQKMVGQTMIEVGVFDAALHREHRALLNQVEESLGQSLSRETVAAEGAQQFTVSFLDSIVERVEASKRRIAGELVDIIAVDV